MIFYFTGTGNSLYAAQKLPRLRDPVREKDGLPRAVRQSGVEVKSGKPGPAETHTNRKCEPRDNQTALTVLVVTRLSDLNA